MKKRIITGLFGAVFIIFVTYMGGIIFDVTYYLITLIALHEIETALGKYYNIISFKLNYIFATFVITIEIFNHNEYLRYIIIFYVISNLLIYISNSNIKIMDISIVVMTGLYVVLFFYCMILLKDTNYVWIVYVITYSTDTFAYFIGKKFGSKKIFPKLSPKKTLEGVIAGLFGSLIITMLLNVWFFNIDAIQMLILTIIASIMSVIGDLTASKIKRETQIKDFSNFLPGHGGIMDRFDSLLFVAPVVYLFYVIVGLN